MIDYVKLIQTKAFARQDGAILGTAWIASFVCTMLATIPSNTLLGIISNLLIISTPFIVARRLKSFRDGALDGFISFRRGLFYCFQTFFNATLLLTIVQYLWFRFMDTGAFLTMLIANYKIIMEAYKLSAEEIKTLTDAIAMMKPIAWASMFMVTDLIVGIILSPLIAAIMTRKMNRQEIINQQ